MLKELQSESEAVQYDANCLTYETIAAYDEGSNEIKRSLNPGSYTQLDVYKRQTLDGSTNARAL